MQQAVSSLFTYLRGTYTWHEADEFEKSQRPSEKSGVNLHKITKSFRYSNLSLVK
jgi:hypothetical protein